jgi:hypothetical protein
MKKISYFLGKNKKLAKALDDKSIFFIFRKIIKSEYGAKGEQGLFPEFYKKGKLFLRAKNSNWANEIWSNRQDVLKKINNEIGTEEVQEIKVQR